MKNGELIGWLLIMASGAAVAMVIGWCVLAGYVGGVAMIFLASLAWDDFDEG